VGILVDASHRLNWRAVLAFAVCSVWVLGTARGQSLNQQIAGQVDSLLRAAASNGFGGAVVIERNGETMLSSGYGFASRQSARPFRPTTIAPIGSITKTFTAFAIVQLSTERKLDLQRPLGTYLINAREPAASARLHDILTHESGLAEYCGGDWVRRTKPQLIAECSGVALTAKPGTVSYSNPGYSFLAAVVEEVSGQQWQDYLRDRVFTPAAMTHSGWLFPNRAGLDLAEGYLDDKPQGIEADRVASFAGEVWNLKGNGGLQVSASDMQRFYRFLSRRPSVRELMTKPQSGEYETGIWEGYGFGIRTCHAARACADVKDTRLYRLGSSGSDGVFLSYFAWWPDQQTFMYLVGNNGEQRVRPVLGAVIDTIQKVLPPK
jgi:CubicO group peptidase (beta-lactamase class C family)